MPYADDEKKIGHMKLWRKKRMGQGYGKWLYARRKLRFDNAVRFEQAIREALDTLAGPDWEREIPTSGPAFAVGATNILYHAIMEARAAEERLGPFVPPSDEEQSDV